MAEEKASQKFLKTPDPYAYKRHPLATGKAVTIDMEYDADAAVFVTYVNNLHRPVEGSHPQALGTGPRNLPRMSRQAGPRRWSRSSRCETTQSCGKLRAVQVFFLEVAAARPGLQGDCQSDCQSAAD